MRYALLLLIIMTACANPPPPDGLAQAIEGSPTFAFDGKNLTLVESGDEAVFTFTSSHAGYGRREGIELPQQETQHRMVVRSVDGEIVEMIIDGFWDELAQQPVAMPADREATSQYAVTCTDSIPDPIISYENSSVVITHFAQGCGKRQLEYRLDRDIYPPTLHVTIHDAQEPCPINCSTGISTFTIPAPEVGAIVLDDGDVTTYPIGGFYCRDESCPAGYFCAKPERGGICVLNSTEDDDILFERYTALRASS